MSACSTQIWAWRQGLSRSPRLDIAPPRSRVSQPESAMRCSFQATSQATGQRSWDIYTRQPRRLVTYFAPQRSIVLLRKFSLTNNTVCGGRLVSTLTFISRERQYTNINRQQGIAPGAVRRYVLRRGGSTSIRGRVRSPHISGGRRWLSCRQLQLTCLYPSSCAMVQTDRRIALFQNALLGLGT